MAIFGNKTEEAKETKAAAAPKKAKKPALKESAFADRVLLRPRVTEKAYALNALNKYVFVVTPEADKASIKRAVEEIYGVHVTGVTISRVPKKKRLVGMNRQVGFKKSLKKAIVTLAQGENIELFAPGI